MSKTIKLLIFVASMSMLVLNSLVAAPTALSVATDSGQAPGESASDILSDGEKPSAVAVTSSCGTALTLFGPLWYACLIANTNDYIQRKPKMAICASAVLFDAFLLLPCMCNICLASQNSCSFCNKPF